jgi:isoleucyl-tRNA synthetase
MRWAFARARPEDNINFGWHAGDEARRELLVLWNTYAFFVTYARLADWTPRADIAAEIARADGAGSRWPALDRWILSRAAALAERSEDRLRDYDALGAAREISVFIDDLSTWYLRLSRDRMRGRAGTGAVADAAAARAGREAAFATFHAALVSLVRTAAPILPFLTESLYQNLMTAVVPGAPESVHLTRYPTAELAGLRDEALERSMAIVRRAVELVRTLRSQAGIRTRQPLARVWLALPGGSLAGWDELAGLFADEVNVREVALIGDESELVERRVKPLLPKIGKRLGPAIPAVMAAARAGEVDFLADGGVRLAGETLGADEVEILATPRPGTAVAHDEGLVVVVDTELTRELRAEGDARELQRAIQDLRREAELDLGDRIVVWASGLTNGVLEHADSIRAETLADELRTDDPPGDVPRTVVDLESGSVTVGLRVVDGGGRGSGGG